jgi:hypothetical protein
MGERRRRLTLPKQRRVGVARQPVKVPLLIDDLDDRAAGRQTFVSRYSNLKGAGLARFDFGGGLFRMGFEHYMRDITAPPSASIGDREFCAPA